MSVGRQVTGAFWTSPQIAVQDLPEIARMGVRLVVNNRPEYEEPGQPSGDEIAAAAKAAGVAYVAVPVRGRPSAEQVEAMRAALEEVDGPVLAYCRSGLRSIATWALGQVASGERSREEVVALAADAGYDLSALFA
jgi:uncharacterized protein (TIGR01244 family)